MKKQLFAIATGLTLGAAALVAQQGGQQGGQTQQPVFSFQSTSTIGGGGTLVAAGGRGGALVTGSPMSAKEVNKTVQTLSDGTELENTRSTMFYRDSQGRTRSEPLGSEAPIVILDPVAALRITLMPATKTAIRAQAPALAAGRGGTVSYSYSVSSSGDVQQMAAQLADEIKATTVARATTAPAGKNQSNTEDLGFQMQNGVLAQGTRTTLTIPQGQIGNNREIHVVNERWYSKDLQMLVKSVNSDPRYGVTTFDLQNLSQNAPDPTLFQIPTGYTINEGGRGARGGVIVGK